jgi:hypothetical protein
MPVLRSHKDPQSEDLFQGDYEITEDIQRLTTVSESCKPDMEQQLLEMSQQIQRLMETIAAIQQPQAQPQQPVNPWETLRPETAAGIEPPADEERPPATSGGHHH